MPVPASNVTSLESGDPPKADAKHPSSSQDEYIYVPDDFKVKEGARLTEQLTIGKALGVGLQVNFQSHRSSLCIILSCGLSRMFFCRVAFSCFKTTKATQIQIQC